MGYTLHNRVKHSASYSGVLGRNLMLALPIPRVFAFVTLLLMVSIGVAQEPVEKLKKQPPPAKSELTPAPAKVDVIPLAQDEDISERLQSVLEATGWFIEPTVRVENGVAFLSGRTENDDLKKWAGDLARNTQDVVAVANRIDVIEPSIWDFRPAWAGVLVLWRDLIRSLPFVMFGVFIMILSVFMAKLAIRIMRAMLRNRPLPVVLQNVLANSVGVLVFLAGTYLILRIFGLTQLALTVVGGTGLLGLALGIAFREITENFLASIFLSLQRPFEAGDLVEITGITGYVQQLNIRSTILMTLEGILVQIPNAAVYKCNLRNFTTNSNRREDFVFRINYDESIQDAQEVARKVLMDHPAILNDPEPSVLADSLEPTAINLRVYFWINGREHSWLKVRSAVIRLVKLAMQQYRAAKLEAANQEVIAPLVTIPMRDAVAAAVATPVLDAASTNAEAGLYSEASMIKEQARHIQPLNDGENLLKPTPDTPPK